MAKDCAFVKLLKLVLDSARPFADLPLAFADWEAEKSVDLNDGLHSKLAINNHVEGVGPRPDVIHGLTDPKLDIIHGCIDVNELDGWKLLKIRHFLKEVESPHLFDHLVLPYDALVIFAFKDQGDNLSQCNDSGCSLAMGVVQGFVPEDLVFTNNSISGAMLMASQIDSTLPLQNDEHTVTKIILLHH